MREEKNGSGLGYGQRRIKVFNEQRWAAKGDEVRWITGERSKERIVIEIGPGPIEAHR